ncbi:MAG: hypothetical protein IJT92_00905 [Spirochaetia bacterium]|nr:hypothetical protein [Spirochaetia bacterium]
MYPYQTPQFPQVQQMPQFYTTPQFPTPQNNSPRLVCKQVGSIDEAKSAIIDPFSLFVFVDFSTGKIYVKKMGNDGKSEFFIYSQEPGQTPADPIEDLRQRIANIEARLGGSNGESIPNVPAGGAGNEKSNGGNTAAAS